VGRTALTLKGDLGSRPAWRLAGESGDEGSRRGLDVGRRRRHRGPGGPGKLGPGARAGDGSGHPPAVEGGGDAGPPGVSPRGSPQVAYRRRDRGEASPVTAAAQLRRESAVARTRGTRYRGRTAPVPGLAPVALGGAQTAATAGCVAVRLRELREGGGVGPVSALLIPGGLPASRLSGFGERRPR
jgi:hypothetical protein